MLHPFRTCGWALIAVLVGSTLVASLGAQEPIHIPIRARPAVPQGGEVAHVRIPVRITPRAASSSCPDCVTHVPIRVRVASPLEPMVVAAPEPGDMPLPINLPTALYLAGVPSEDVLYAQQRTQAAVAWREQAQVRWLPAIRLTSGSATDTTYIVSTSLYTSLVARQFLLPAQAESAPTRASPSLAVTERYFAVQQARGELAGALDVARRSGELAQQLQQLPREASAGIEVFRALGERDRSRYAVEAAREHWRAASAELARQLRLSPPTLLNPVEPPQLCLEWVDGRRPVDDLIRVALVNRSELVEYPSLVEATLRRLDEQGLRPLMPSLLLRGPGNTIDTQALAQFQRTCFGNAGMVGEQRTRCAWAVVELFRTQDRIAAEVVDAHEHARSAAARVAVAESALRNALELANRAVEGAGQVRRAGGLLVPLVRPQEAVAAVAWLSRCYADYYAAVAEANRAQCRLYHALGEPARRASARDLQARAGRTP